MQGERPDLIIGSSQSISNLLKAGRIESHSQLQICKVGVGVVVPSGGVKPPIDSIGDFKLALLQARVIVYADPNRGGAAGIHIARVIDKLGLAGQKPSMAQEGTLRRLLLLKAMALSA